MAFIQLINTPSGSDSAIKDKWYVPQDLLWIGTYLKQHGHEVHILDGQTLSLNEILSQISAPIVGIGFQIYSASQIDKVIGAAKDAGSLVLVGGQAATPLAENLLSGNRDIAAVVCNDGEEALRKLADAFDECRDPFLDAPNVVYRRKGKIIRNQIEKVPLASLPIPDRRLKGIDIEQYIKNFQTTNSFLGFNGMRVTNAHTKKGCPRRCSFCGRLDKIYRSRMPQQAFDEYQYLVRDFGVDYIFDHSDSWAVSASWLEQFRAVYERQGGLKARLSVFADLRDLTPSVIADMRAVGVDTVEVGIESGDEGILRENRKFMASREIIDRVLALTKAGMKVEASYVLGILGETRESVRDTLNLSRKLRERTGRIRNYFNIIFPLPGTLIWERLLLDPEMKEKYGNDYVFDIEQLRKDYLSRHCDLGLNAYDFLMEEREEILIENGLPVMDYAR